MKVQEVNTDVRVWNTLNWLKMFSHGESTPEWHGFKMFGGLNKHCTDQSARKEAIYRIITLQIFTVYANCNCNDTFCND